jgi:hypothetical protein
MASADPPGRIHRPSDTSTIPKTKIGVTPPFVARNLTPPTPEHAPPITRMMAAHVLRSMAAA